VKARKWLAAQGVEVESRPIKEQPPTLAELRDFWKRSSLPIKRFFNTSGGSYRALDRSKLEAMSDEEKLKLLSGDGMLVKRPILDDGKTVLVGFDEDAYAAWKERR
jgi:arsenate reductase (glutaredoxin)